jgi:SAM-dependent methyltransferase
VCEQAPNFGDSEGYERFMGCWSRAACPRFLQWIEAPGGMSWLDAGCGNGILAETILRTVHPFTVHGVDPAVSQVAQARRRAGAPNAHFQVADARQLPFRDACFDVAAAALVLNFIAERAQAVAELARVTRPDGMVAAFVWDFEAQRSPSGPMRAGLRAAGFEAPAMPGTASSSIPALRQLFTRGGLAHVAATSFEVSVAFPDFDAFWQAQTPAYNPITQMLEAMDPDDRARCRAAVKAGLPKDAQGRPCYSARANAVRGRVRA